MSDKSKRVQLLEEAAALTAGDRNQSYGDPHTNLTCYADMIEAYLVSRGWRGPALNSVDGGAFMALAKMSRIGVNQFHEDNFKDGAAYFAIMGECATKVLTNSKVPG